MKNKSILAGIILSVSACTTAWAVDADSLKKQALEACEATAKQTPEAYREMSLKTCKCAVKKTDYKVILSGDSAKAQENALKIAQECAKEASST